MEVLTAFVREHSPREEEQAPQEEEIQDVPLPGHVQVPSQSSSNPPVESPRLAAPTELTIIPVIVRPSRKLPIEIQAVLTVLARRRWTFGQGENQQLNLSQTDLRAADLSEVNLRGIDLGQADLREARLQGADLSEALLDGSRLAKANFVRANLRGAFLTEANCKQTDLGEADLTDAHLYKADLREAHLFHTTLIRTDLRQADLRRAFLGSADLTDALLRKADLRGAFLGQTLGLTREQVESAVTDEKAEFPDSLKTQMHPAGKK